jgi:hypothetical protein
MYLHEGLRSILKNDEFALRHKTWRGKRRIEVNMTLDICRYYNEDGSKGDALTFTPGLCIDFGWELVDKRLF